MLQAMIAGAELVPIPSLAAGLVASVGVMSSSSVPSTPMILRGAPHRKTNFMEEFQKSYLRAIAAASGCVVGTFEFDDGIDVQFNHKSEHHVQLTDRTARLELQLKATHVPMSNGHISVKMTQQRFRYYRTENPTLHKLVVIMHVPSDPADWILATEESLSMHHCAYWINLVDYPDSPAENPTVSAPGTNIFDDAALCGIMKRIGEGGRP